MQLKPYWLISLILLAALCGIAGYYGGYRAACKEFAEQWSAEALNDRVASAVYSLYADESQGDEEDVQEQEAQEVAVSEQESQLSEKEPAPSSDEVVPPEELPSNDTHLTYEAHLAGFGTQAAADRYVARLKAEGIAAHVVKRDTLTSRRRHITWYQVVTDPQAYDQLLATVTFLKKRDKLEGVAIVEVGSDHKNIFSKGNA